MDAHLSPQRKARRARRMRREEAAWARRAGDIDTRIACVCDRHPETCRAEHHTTPAQPQTP